MLKEKANFSIPIDKIIPVSDLVRNFKEISKKIELDNINFLFKNKWTRTELLSHTIRHKF